MTGAGEVLLRGHGTLLTFASAKPRSCSLGGRAIDFEYDSDTSRLTVQLQESVVEAQQLQILF